MLALPRHKGGHSQVPMALVLASLFSLTMRQAIEREERDMARLAELTKTHPWSSKAPHGI